MRTSLTLLIALALLTNPAAQRPSLTGAAAQTVSWNAANTASPPVSAANILFSTDGGLSFGTELLASTPNDGSQNITLLNLTTNAARNKVAAVGNLFLTCRTGIFLLLPIRSMPFQARRRVSPALRVMVT